LFALFDLMAKWNIQEAEDYYGFKRWGGGHFSVDSDGYVQVHPAGDARTIRIHDIVREAISKGIQPPLTIRIQDLLRTRVIELNECFAQSMKDEEYSGRYRGVFPIKVNQLREVVEEIRDAGEEYDFGLECGSKPELMIALSMHKNPKALIVCNGYKDDEFIELALFGRRLGKEIYLVVEQLSEVRQIIELAKKSNTEPLIGVRIKLSTAGEGKWASSSGEDAKFGLTSPEIVEAARLLRDAGLEQSLRLVHFHIGSQVPNILTIKKATIEATRFYCELKKMGFPMGLIDIGGGLGIDYDGSKSNFESSMNYTMAEYVRDVVANIKYVCEQAEVPTPDIVSESGRAIVAPHSILVTEVFDRISKLSVGPTKKSARKGKRHPILKELDGILENTHEGGRLERYHDALQKRDDACNLFNLGYLDLATRAEADALFWKICDQLKREAADATYTPEELEILPSLLADQYVCNFSVFQSLIDHWACNQLFPLSPLQRLDERPDVDATLVDITCDSEGKVAKFVDVEDERTSIRLHRLDENEPYYIGVFMVGAYQDIMGDLHNLFGRVNEVHVFLEDDEEDGYYIEDQIKGFTVRDVLRLTQHEASELTRNFKRQIDRATREDRVRPREGVNMLETYTAILNNHTYLKV